MTANSAAGRRFFFGHQSVGADIIAGIHSLAPVRKIPHIEKLPTAQAAVPEGPTLLHAPLGRNGDPASKLAAFAEWLDAGVGDQVDHAMLKFCYVDLTAVDQADSLAQAYDDCMARIRASHPRLRLVHCTIPLRTLPRGAYATVRRMLGHRHASIEGNRARERFNTHLRLLPAGELLFDLARHESTHANGRICAHRSGPAQVPGLVPDYTADGGHLNERGRQIVAGAFLNMFDALEAA
jgi:hypothetical protein